MKVNHAAAKPAAGTRALDSDVIASDVMLPSQVQASGVPSIGVVRLARAVLLDAIVVMSLPDCWARREAAVWFESTCDESPFSFLSVCAALKFDPAWIRENLPRAKIRERRRAA